ncbi:MAG: DUF5675 family protein [Endomicrobium sp.]|jgi:hypothetical protein|nr:DUF5675 family protein [Endomicrobium sp.]
MVKLLLQRKSYKKKYIIGNLFVNSFLLCNTLENSGFKIPKGTYKVKLTMSSKFGRKLPELVNVPNRMAIRIHRGNSAKDTQECILVGINDKAGWLSNSAKYEQKIVELIKQYKGCWIMVAKN